MMRAKTADYEELKHKFVKMQREVEMLRAKTVEYDELQQKSAQLQQEVRCSVLQCVAVCCSVLQCVAVCCSVLQYTTSMSDAAQVSACKRSKFVAECCSSSIRVL